MLSSSYSFVKFWLFLFLCVLILHEDHDSSSQNVIEGTILLVVEDYLAKARFDDTNVGYDELEVLFSFLLVDQRKQRNFHEKILSSHSKLGCKLELGIEYFIASFLKDLKLHYKTYLSSINEHQSITASFQERATIFQQLCP
jgi:hypothetical protein